MNDKPAVRASAITKSDSAINAFRAIYIGTGGDVAIIAQGDTAAVTLKNVPSGSLLPISTLKVMSTNTTATDMVGLL